MNGPYIDHDTFILPLSTVRDSAASSDVVYFNSASCMHVASYVKLRY